MSIVVFAAVPSDQRLAPAPATAEKVAPDALREMFSLDPDDLERTIPYSGVPALPAGTPAVPEREVARGKSGADGTFRVPVRARGPFRVEARKEGVGQVDSSFLGDGQ